MLRIYAPVQELRRDSHRRQSNTYIEACDPNLEINGERERERMKEREGVVSSIFRENGLKVE